MEIEVFKLLIYSYGFDADDITKQCFPSFRQSVYKQYGIEPSSSQFRDWLIELKNQITSFQIVTDDEAMVNDLIIAMKAEELIKQKNLLMKEAG